MENKENTNEGCKCGGCCDVSLDELLKVKVKYVDVDETKDDAYQPLQAIAIGDWIDVRSAETVELKKGDFAEISLGFAMEIPFGFEAHLCPRSSTTKKFGVLQTNAPGVIDNSYCGDNDIWKMPVLAIRDTVIHRGDRIGQFRLVERMPVLSFETVKTLGNPDRGGLGSTGRN